MWVIILTHHYPYLLGGTQVSVIHQLKMHQRSGSTLAQVMAWYLTAPSRYLNQCWVIINEVLWHPTNGNSTGYAQDIYPWHEFENYQSKITLASSRGQWLIHRGRDKMAAISQMTCSSEFSWMKYICIWFKISLKFIPKGPINNIPALFQIMAWWRPGNKPLFEPMMT